MMAPLVETCRVSKSFGGIHALQEVSIHVMPGEVLGICGHNGAGKSTLIKILSGAHQADTGEILVDGVVVQMNTPRDARHHGIETIYQDLALAENLDAAANLFFGRELTNRLGFLDADAMRNEAHEVLKRLKIRIRSVTEKVGSLSGGQRQGIAIGRAIYHKARVLIMDEPTAALGPEETRQVGHLIGQLKAEGVGIILISHDIHDVFDLTDRITVLKNGRVVDTVRPGEVTKNDVLALIILGKSGAKVNQDGA
jgi:D-xylose transport system ATP-binding protein